MSADLKSALIGRAVIGNRRGTVTVRGFARIAEAAGRAALAPTSRYRVAGKSNRRKRSSVNQFVTSRW